MPICYFCCGVVEYTILDFNSTDAQLQHDPYDVNTYTKLISTSSEGQVPQGIFKDEDAAEKGGLQTVNAMVLFI